MITVAHANVSFYSNEFENVTKQHEDRSMISLVYILIHYCFVVTGILLTCHHMLVHYSCFLLLCAFYFSPSSMLTLSIHILESSSHHADSLSIHSCVRLHRREPNKRKR